jgi:NAD(P)-dependent dehydrogenase (short-subunit alcohol dehydrogenase family)
MMRRHDGQIVIVTGAGSGIGKGISQVFAKHGATVVLATLKDEEGKQLEREICNAGGQSLYVHTNVAMEQSVKALVDRVSTEFGRIDVMINNAGITLFKPLLEATLEDFEQVINVDLRGVFLCSKYAASVMAQQGSGCIINISSNHAKATLPDTEIYAAAKAGVVGMTRSMALSLGKFGIRVNAICPGFTDTPHYRRWLQSHAEPTETEQEVLALHASGRVARPDDIGEFAAYLASEAGEMLTGGEYYIDGGVTARLY